MASKVSQLFALSLLLFAVAVHGCEPYCSGQPAVPPPPVPTPYHGQHCPIDALKLRVCANVLNGVKIGVPNYGECCPLLQGLVDLDAAVCLCTAVRANVLGIHLDVAIDINLVLNGCGKQCPSGFTCPA